jgi:hypothetical protein
MGLFCSIFVIKGRFFRILRLGILIGVGKKNVAGARVIENRRLQPE